MALGEVQGRAPQSPAAQPHLQLMLDLTSPGWACYQLWLMHRVILSLGKLRQGHAKPGRGAGGTSLAATLLRAGLCKGHRAPTAELQLWRGPAAGPALGPAHLPGAGT